MATKDDLAAIAVALYEIHWRSNEETKALTGALIDRVKELMEKKRGGR